MSSLLLANDEPKLRLCCVKKVSNFDGYGFDLRNLKNRFGHFIGNIDPRSPAEVAGLRVNDRVIEVNGINVSNENHYQVVERIKAVPTETRLLVVDQATDDYYRERNIPVSGDMPNIVYMENKSSDEIAKITSSLENVHVNRNTKIDVRLPPHLPAPRLCYLVMWPDVEGYGFTLHMEKGKTGQYIGEVSDETPAASGGLQTGDRILAVNGYSVIGDSHKEVVRKMKEINGEVRLLVCRPKMEEFLKANDIILTDDVPGIEIIKCPLKNPFVSDVPVEKFPPAVTTTTYVKPETESMVSEIISQRRPSNDSVGSYSIGSSKSSSTHRSVTTGDVTSSPQLMTSGYDATHNYNDTSSSPKPDSRVYDATRNYNEVSTARNVSNSVSTNLQSSNVSSASFSSTDSPERSKTLTNKSNGEGPVTSGDPEFPISAAEARDRLRTQRRRERARISNMTVNEKYNIYQQL